MKLARVVETWAEAKATRSRKAKTAALARCLDESGSHLPIVASWLSGEMPQGRIGVGMSLLVTVREAADVAPEAPEVSVAEVHATLSRIKEVAGAGSKAERLDLLAGLYGRCTYPERLFLLELISGELRQGALEAVLLDAVASLTGLDGDLVRRAFMIAGDLPAVTVAAVQRGAEGLAAFRVELFRPLRPMLAGTAQTPAEAMGMLGEQAFFDHKLDGVRVQIHRDGDVVRVYTRHLHDVTGMVPEVAQAARTFPWEQFVLDGEAIALRDDGSPHPFQVTMRRFGRKADVGRLRLELPLTTVIFDAVMLGGEECIDWPAHRRFEALERLPARNQVQRARVTSTAEAEEFYAGALDLGHEGVMAKDPVGTYQAGARGRAWLKVKPSHTLDLVVLAAEWGSGRRRGWLSNLHLGARDPENGGFVMLGKTFKGLTDELLAWQTDALQARQLRTNGWQVFVRPELVVEVAFNDVQRSPQYPGGVALRFARVKRYRTDKVAEEADTVDAVRALLPVA